MLRRTFMRSAAAAPAGLFGFPCGLAAQQRGAAPPDPFQPAEAPNSPIGAGQGIHPGRVVWVRDAEAARWDGVTGHWWDDASTDQRVVNRMTSKSLLDLTGRRNEKQAWDALFRNFNETHRRGGSGYRRGEKVVIKINANQDRGPDWSNMVRGSRVLNGLPSPHAIAALVHQLVTAGGVRGEDIVVYDVTGGRTIGQPVYTRIKGSSEASLKGVSFLVGSAHGLAGRLSPEPDLKHAIRFSKDGIPAAYLPREITAAQYMINMALLRPHGMAALTLIGKNHFGSICFPEDGGWSPRVLHNHVLRTAPMGSYNALVDLMGHRHLGGKTMLYVLDGLYTAAHNEGNVYRWQSFGDQWAASLLMSQDPVALDSVGLDILRNEPRATEVRGNADNYLHEAALADAPPSGTVYNPSQDARLASLGAHEHWNNPTARQYSRNLGRKEGIELVASLQRS